MGKWHNVKIVSLLMMFIWTDVESKSYAQEKSSTGSAQEITFTTGKWKDVVSLAKKRHQYIFVDAFTSWCAPCKLLRSTTFKEEKAASYFNAHFVNYSIDMEKGEGIELAKQWEVEAYPTLLFFDPSGKMVLKQVGFVNGEQLINFGQQVMIKK